LSSGSGTGHGYDLLRIFCPHAGYEVRAMRIQKRGA
jgi:hypothetical protein